MRSVKVLKIIYIYIFEEGRLLNNFEFVIFISINLIYLKRVSFKQRMFYKGPFIYEGYTSKKMGEENQVNTPTVHLFCHASSNNVPFLFFSMVLPLGRGFL